MFCIYCGASIPKDALFCSACGKQTVHAAEGAPAPAETAQRAAAVDAPVITTLAADTALPAAPPVARKSIASILWVVGGVVVVVLVLGLWGISKGGSGGSSSDSGTSGYTAAPTAGTPPADPAPQIVDDTPPPESAPPAEPAPVAAPAPAPPPQSNSIVGTWKTPTALGDYTMELGADGRYTIKGTLVNDYGVYVYSNDGSLQLQSQSFFDGKLVTWRCQIIGDTLSVIEQTGAAHVYTRAN